MTPTDNRLSDQQNRFLAGARAEEKQRQAGYREKALKLFPWVCARCTREFSLKNVRELTVHHKDHNHDNNPANGSNWELLCLYCHDHEHTRSIQQQRDTTPDDSVQDGLTHSPFASLTDKFKK